MKRKIDLADEAPQHSISMLLAFALEFHVRIREMCSTYSNPCLFNYFTCHIVVPERIDSSSYPINL